MPEWLVHLIALIIHCILKRKIAAQLRRASLPTWWHDRPDLPLGSAQSEAASIRGPFGNAIRWMCRRRGIGPGHKDWPELSRAIVAFGGSLKGFRPGLPAFGLQWWENPNVVPGMTGETIAAPAAEAMGALLLRQAADAAEAPAPAGVPRSDAEPASPLALRRRVFARTATGPPTGPPAVWAIKFLGVYRVGCCVVALPFCRVIASLRRAEKRSAFHRRAPAGAWQITAANTACASVRWRNALRFSALRRDPVVSLRRRA